MNDICRKLTNMPDGCIVTWEMHRRHWITLKRLRRHYLKTKDIS